MKNNYLKAKIGNLKIESGLTIPSGIITTTPDSCELIAHEIKEIGIITTKSIGIEKREGNTEPILAQSSQDTFINAVGLSNPGYKEFTKEIAEVYPLPNNKILLISIFGSTVEEFVKIAKALENYSDAFELNFSCPHAKGYGMFIGQNTELTYEITKAVKDNVKIPVVAKLTPNVYNIKDIASAAAKAGADAITAINTVGPGYVLDAQTGDYVLSNRFGGISGAGIRPIGLKCVKEISEAVTIPIIGMGGIETAEDGAQYIQAGASVLGIGTALRGMSTSTLKKYFRCFKKDLLAILNNKKHSRENEMYISKKMIMSYEYFRITKIEEISKDLKIFCFDRGIDAKAGQFVFVKIVGGNEKPFSIAFNKPLVIAVRKVGDFTSKLFEMKEGDLVKIRGPYGNFFIPEKNIIAVAGGTGAAPIYFLSRCIRNLTIFLGAKTKDELLFKEHFENNGKVFLATNDGSIGYKGFVTQLLEEYLSKNKFKDIFFVNCGPEKMMAKAVEIELKYTTSEKIFCSIERYTKCGIGICGSCSIDGYRACVDGPVFDGRFLNSSKYFGKWVRDKSGTKVIL